MSLLQAVFRTQTIDSLDKVLSSLSGRNSPDDNEEFVKVVSAFFRYQVPCKGFSYDGLPPIYSIFRCLSRAFLAC